MTNDLTENEVVDRVASWLLNHGYKITSKAYIRQQGDDVAAISPNDKHLFIECKGSISDSGKKGDLWVRVSGAIFTAIRDKESQRPHAIHGLAFPDVEGYRRLMNGLEKFCHRERIPVFWVSGEASWEIWCRELIL